MLKSKKTMILENKNISHGEGEREGRGVRKMPKKCHVFFEWTLKPHWSDQYFKRTPVSLLKSWRRMSNINSTKLHITFNYEWLNSNLVGFDFHLEVQKWVHDDAHQYGQEVHHDHDGEEDCPLWFWHALGVRLLWPAIWSHRDGKWKSDNGDLKEELGPFKFTIFFILTDKAGLSYS